LNRVVPENALSISCRPITTVAVCRAARLERMSLRVRQPAVGDMALSASPTSAPALREKLALPWSTEEIADALDLFVEKGS
jgi:hypothetical protein